MAVVMVLSDWTGSLQQLKTLILYGFYRKIIIFFFHLLLGKKVIIFCL